jgi:hypothetical protein
MPLRGEIQRRFKRLIVMRASPQHGARAKSDAR